MYISYFNITSSIPSRDKVYLQGLAQQGVRFTTYLDHTPGWKKFYNLYRKYRAQESPEDIFWVGYTAHILVPFTRIIARKKIVFNALGSLYEGRIISRNQGFFSRITSWIIDILAFHSAHLILVESESQRSFISDTFFVPKEKLCVIYTGTDEKTFFYDPRIRKLPQFTVIFRGAFLPESGIETILEAAKVLSSESITFRILGTGMMRGIVEKLLATFDTQHVEWIEGPVEPGDLRKIFQECHLSLGQLSKHERLKRTIPHKAFESLALALPYLTARTPAILELLTEGKTCFCSNPADSEDLARMILYLRDNPEKLQEVGQNGYQLFKEKLTGYHLAKSILKNLANLT